MIRLFSRLRPRSPDMAPERAQWRACLESIGYAPDRAAKLEAHKYASWTVFRREIGLGPEDPEGYATYMRPWFEQIWRNSR